MGSASTDALKCDNSLSELKYGISGDQSCGAHPIGPD